MAHMDLMPYVDTVRREFAVAAEMGGEEAVALAERLAAPLASAIRLALLDALSAAADEITSELAPGSIEVRLRAGEPTFVISLPAGEPQPAETPPAQPEPDEAPVADDGAMARINVRLSENLKTRIEEAAATQNRSVNAWFVRAASAALRPTAAPTPPSSLGNPARSAQRYTGWVS